METSLLMAAVIAAGFVLVTGPFFIPELHKLKFGQSIREEGPKSHQAKSGTPTMGGIMIILGITLGTVAVAPLSTEIMLAPPAAAISYSEIFVSSPVRSVWRTAFSHALS